MHQLRHQKFLGIHAAPNLGQFAPTVSAHRPLATTQQELKTRFSIRQTQGNNSS
jgi:hypothetical protein